jgi:pimeloyl-ACP methyl ester carboxylesterase
VSLVRIQAQRQQAKFVDAAGIKTRYLEGGRGTPLLLIHGSAFGEADASANEWEPVFDRLAKAFHVYAIDKIGQGFSDNPRTKSDYVIGTTVRHAHDFLNAMGIRSAHVIGHSRGGYTACRLALEDPGLVDSLVIVDSGTLMRPEHRFYEDLEQKLMGIDDVIKRYRFMIQAHSWSYEHVTDQWLSMIAELHELPKMREAATIMGVRLYPGGGVGFSDDHGVGGRFLRDMYERQRETHDWIRSGGIKAPVLVVWGFNDPSAPLDPVGLNTMRLIFPHVSRAALHVLSRAGHYCFREQPEAFAAACIGFLRSVDGNGQRRQVSEKGGVR